VEPWNSAHPLSRASSIISRRVPMAAGRRVEGVNSDVRQRINPIQVAIGDFEFDFESFYSILSQRACDIIQPELQ